MSRSFITVITVVFNDVNTIENTIKSIVTQSYENYEFIVIDGGSTDGTVEIIRSYRDQINYIISESDNGIYDAMNKALRIAKGEWVNFINSGDFYTSTHVLSNISKYYLKGNSAYSIVHTDILEGGVYTSQNIFSGYILKNICHQSIFYNRFKLKKVLKYNTKYKLAADFDLLVAIYYMDPDLFSLKTNEADIYYLPGGISHTNKTVTIKERIKIIVSNRRNLGLNRYVLNLLNGFKNAIIK
jgi:glycosyltransferase involved in cell wall biosynthesis